MELLVDLLPLLVIYAIARAVSRKRSQEAARARAKRADEAPTVSPNLEALLAALGVEPPPPAPAPGATDAEEATATRRAMPRQREPEAVPLRPSYEPRLPGSETRRTPPARVAEGGYFESSDFEERGTRRSPPVVAAPAAPRRPAAGLAERLRDPATAREAFVLQTLLSRRRAR